MELSNGCCLKTRFTTSTKCVREILDIFNFAYEFAGEIMINSLLDNIGIFNLIEKGNNDSSTSNSYLCQNKKFIGWSNIWTSYREVSSLLYNSFIHQNICAVDIKYIDENALSDNIINLKKELCIYLQKNADFLAYCDMEYCGIFLYTNGKQALSKDEFLHHYRKSYASLNILEKKYINRTPKIVMTIFDDIRELITIRDMYGESLIIPPDPYYLPKVPFLNYHLFQDVLDKFNSSDILETADNLEIIYKQMIPLDIISKMMLYYDIQGIKNDNQLSLSEYLGSSLYYISKFKEFINTGMLSRIKQQIMYMPIVKRVFDVSNNRYFLDQFSNESLGDTLGCLVGNVMKLYLKNVKIIVLGDMLHMGYYNVINNTFYPSIEQITQLLEKAKKDEIALKALFDKHHDICILNRLLRIFQIAIKRVSRFQKKVYKLQFKDEESELFPSHDIISMIFGDVYDNDGTPTVCCVCLDNSCEKKDTWMQCSNGHKLHYDCYNETINSAYKNCPLCRVNLLV
jgi:hypothetical protein